MADVEDWNNAIKIQETHFDGGQTAALRIVLALVLSLLSGCGNSLDECGVFTDYASADASMLECRAAANDRAARLEIGNRAENSGEIEAARSAYSSAAEGVPYTVSVAVPGVLPTFIETERQSPVQKEALAALHALSAQLHRTSQFPGLSCWEGHPLQTRLRLLEGESAVSIGTASKLWLSKPMLLVDEPFLNQIASDVLYNLNLHLLVTDEGRNQDVGPTIMIKTFGARGNIPDERYCWRTSGCLSVIRSKPFWLGDRRLLGQAPLGTYPPTYLGPFQRMAGSFVEQVIDNSGIAEHEFYARTCPMLGEQKVVGVEGYIVFDPDLSHIVYAECHVDLDAPAEMKYLLVQECILRSLGAFHSIDECEELIETEFFVNGYLLSAGEEWNVPGQECLPKVLSELEVLQ